MRTPGKIKRWAEIGKLCDHNKQDAALLFPFRLLLYFGNFVGRHGDYRFTFRIAATAQKRAARAAAQHHSLVALFAFAAAVYRAAGRDFLALRVDGKCVFACGVTAAGHKFAAPAAADNHGLAAFLALFIGFLRRLYSRAG